MALWRAQALTRLPGLRSVIDSSDSVIGLWCALSSSWRAAYERQPPEGALIDAIFSFADWCSTARPGPDAGHDPQTAVMVCFYEHLPTLPAAREDMPRWFTPADIAGLRSVFVYAFGEQGYRDLLGHVVRNRHKYVHRIRAE